MRTKNFTLLTLALFVMSVVAFAQKPNSTQRVLTPKQQLQQAIRTGQLTKENAGAFKFAKPALPQIMQKTKANKQILPVTQKAPAKGALGQKLDYAVSPRTFNQQALRSARRAASDYPIITEAPAGETKAYKRAGSYTYVSSGSAYIGTQSGTMEVVFTSDNKVYMKDPICGVTTGAYVEGTLSGNTITVPLGQNIYYSSTYDYAMTTCLADLSGAVVLDKETAAITYTIDGETITQNGTSQSNALTCYWTDDDSWSGYSEWETVLTEYVAPPVVTPPAGLVTEDWTVGRYFYDGEDEISEEKVLKVGFDGNDVYVYGFSYNTVTEGGWIKGTLSDDGKSISFASGQYYGYDDSYNDYFFVTYDYGTKAVASAVVVDYDAEAGTMTWPENVLIVESDIADISNSMSGYFYWIPAMVRGTAPDPLPAPDIITSEWLFKSQNISQDPNSGEPVATEYNLHVQVGIGTNEVFVQGLCEDLPETWIKGTLDPATNKVTFPTGQYFGTYTFWFWDFDYFFAGYGTNGFEDVVMDYDAEAKTLTMESPDYIFINPYWLLVDPNLALTDVQMNEIPLHEITFAAADDISIQNGKAAVTVDGKAATVSAEGKLTVLEGAVVNIKAAKDYRFVSMTSTEATVTLADDLFSASFVVPTTDATINYQIREMGGDIIFATEGEYTIQDGLASVLVDDADVTKNIDENGLLIDNAEGATVTINAAQGYKLASVEASYKPKATGSKPTINYTLTDSYGDGWNGNSISIVNASTGIPYEVLTLETGSTVSGTVELEPGKTYNFVWVKGSYPGECSFTITDANGDEIVSAASGTGLDGIIATYTASGTASATVGVDVALAKKGNTASFIMPGRGQVNVTYVIERLGCPIEVPADAYITYYTDKDILIYDTDCELMTVTGLNGNEVAVTPLNVVAANTPMLIHNSGAEKELWIVPAEETADAPAADEVTVLPAFKGTLTGEIFSDADMAAKDYYVFTNNNFVWVRSAGSIVANKCWLEFEKDASPKVPSLAIGFGGGETTGINTVNGKMESDGQYYDLNGRKLNAAPTQKGVYIINGKKAVIK